MGIRGLDRKTSLTFSHLTPCNHAKYLSLPNLFRDHLY